MVWLPKVYSSLVKPNINNIKHPNVFNSWTTPKTKVSQYGPTSPSVLRKYSWFIFWFYQWVIMFSVTTFVLWCKSLYFLNNGFCDANACISLQIIGSVRFCITEPIITNEIQAFASHNQLLLKEIQACAPQNQLLLRKYLV